MNMGEPEVDEIKFRQSAFGAFTSDHGGKHGSCNYLDNSQSCVTNSFGFGNTQYSEVNNVQGFRGQGMNIGRNQNSQVLPINASSATHGLPFQVPSLMNTFQGSKLTKFSPPTRASIDSFGNNSGNFNIKSQVEIPTKQRLFSENKRFLSAIPDMSAQWKIDSIPSSPGSSVGQEQVPIRTFDNFDRLGTHAFDLDKAKFELSKRKNEFNLTEKFKSLVLLTEPIDNEVKEVEEQDDEVSVELSKKICASSDADVFEDFERWLLSNGAEFPLLYLKSYSDDVRGVHCKTYIAPWQTVLSIPLKCLITDYMGRTETHIGRKLFNSSGAANLSTPNLIAVIVYILSTKDDPNHFFQPYYKILPKSYSNFPIFWGTEKLKWLQGSPLLEDIEERKSNMESDYAEICKICPEFGKYSFAEFLAVRTAVGSRNFGISINGEKRTAMVPYADMLNHYRPRETSWTYDNSKNAFTITSINQLGPGQQVMDSYGKKCNSKFFLHYGFAVERNREEDGKCQNELLLRFSCTCSTMKGRTLSTQSLCELNSSSTNSSSSTAPLNKEQELKVSKIHLLNSLFNVQLSKVSSFENSFCASKSFRISMNIEDKSTLEALSFLRVKVATEDELRNLFSSLSVTALNAAGPSGSVSPVQSSAMKLLRGRERCVSFLNGQNEAAMLECLAGYAAQQLKRYANSFEENQRLLNSGEIQPFSDRRTALVVVLGEQEICNFWIKAAKTLNPILTTKSGRTLELALSILPKKSDFDKDLFRYASFIREEISKQILAFRTSLSNSA